MRTALWRAVTIVMAVSALITTGRTQDFSHKEMRASSLSTQWQKGDGLVTRGSDGKVVFLFGQVQPSVVCSPLQVCDIELQAGEVVHDVLLGDTVRWKVEPASSGSPGNQSVHLIVKPAEPGLETSMVVTTSRRSYHFKLTSHHRRYMARVGFEYPDDVKQSLARINARLEASRMPGAGLPAEQLKFNFSMSGSAGWKPTRIYSDGEKTYIQFPRALTGHDAPVLFLLSGGENQIVNYRLKGTLMVVDHDIDHALLVSGVGRSQQKIVIRRRG